METELAIAQQKLRAIDKLTNIIQSKHATKQNKDDIAYFIHQIIESDDWTSELARELLSWQLSAK